MSSEKEEEVEFEENVKDLIKKIEAKRAILREVLRTVEDENQETDSSRTRKYIRDLLHCEVTHTSTVNSLVSVNLIKSFRFDHNVVSRISIFNRLPDKDMTIRISTFPAVRSCRWTVFQNEDTLKMEHVIRANSSAIVNVSLPFSDFFGNDVISLIIRCKVVSSRSSLLTPSFCTILEANQTPSAPIEAVVSIPVDINYALEEVNLKSLEFMDVDEHKTIETIQSLFTCFSRLALPFDFTLIRREFSRFGYVDFDTWRLLIGVDRFESLFILTLVENDEEKHCEVIAKEYSICREFLKLLNVKFGDLH